MTIYNQILYVQTFSACFSLLGLVSARQLGPALAFLSAHPEALTSILALSAAATVGQLFISHTIRSFGALVGQVGGAGGAGSSFGRWRGAGVWGL